MNFQTAHEQALEAAKAGGQKWLDKYGDRDACGFAWVNFYVDGQNKAGRELKKIEGVRRSYDGSLQLWNPATKVGIYVQSVSALEAAADAYAAKFRELTGLKEVYSRIEARLMDRKVLEILKEKSPNRALAEIEKAMEETQSLIDREMKYSPDLRRTDRIVTLSGHLEKLQLYRQEVME